MRHIWVKLLLIIAFILLCVVAVNPPQEKIRLGKDLRGGVSLVYGVKMPEDASDREAILTQTIEVLKQRINPRGLLDISMTPQGLDRFEIVMPLPSREVQDLKKAYDLAMDDLMREAEIPQSRLVDLLGSRQAVATFGEKVAPLQNAFDALQQARAALDAARASGTGVDAAEGAVAVAEITYDDALDEVLGLSLDRERVVQALRRPNDPVQEIDPVTREPRFDETGKRIMGPSQRAMEISRLKGEFPHLSAKLDVAGEAFDAYDAKRTGFDDPEDLIRLMRGAGVLEFHIAISPLDAASGETIGVNIDTMRTELAELGPENTSSRNAKWFPINELQQWYEDAAQHDALIANPSQYFSNRDLVAAEYEGQYFLLLYTNAANSMTHGGEVEWTMNGASNTRDQLGRPAVAFTLDAMGGSLMGRLTGANVGKPMAIVLDGQIYSAPVLRSQINNNGQISGNFSDADISYLIKVLAAGALQARVTHDPIAMNTLGPSIGADNLGRGLEACWLAVIVVALFMLAYYFFAGVVADIALLCNGIIIFGVMAMLDGTFTLPGLAGIVLTIGMAVDANVLIYERIREELFTGEVDLRTAVRLGYQKALSTIIDGNVTNLIVCFVLYKTATTEVKGFALTLAIGIGATLFTALFVTRQIFYVYTEVLGRKTLPMLASTFPAIHRALEPNINWLGLRKVFIPVSVSMVLLSLILVGIRGESMFDTEFRGGVSVTMQTRVETPADGAEDATRLWLPHVGPDSVQERVHEIGRKAADKTLTGFDERELTILSELQRASILTVGDSRMVNGRNSADRFQIKVANPKGLAEDVTIMDTVVSAITEEFKGDLDVTNPLEFAGSESADHAAHTFLIEGDRLGESIGRPTAARVASFIGGVAVVLDDITPPSSLDDLRARIDRMRQHTNYTDAVGRDVEIVGLTAADPNDTAKGYTSVAVVVADPALNGLRPDVAFESWDRNLAAREWSLVREGLTRRSSLEQVTTFSSAVAASLKASAIVAVVLSLLGILVYIWVRFGSFRYSLAAVLALAHDVSIALGLVAVTQLIGSTGIARFLLIEEFQVDLGVVAALLTIIGYSLNDTIVILDRIRENRGKLPLASAEVINRSINQTFSRTTLTSGTTLLAVLIMYIEGGSGIRPFTYCLLAGLVVGTYSSIAIAAPLVFRGKSDAPHREIVAPEPEAA
ncbi:MAG: protein translocase subunit SecD [Phycisphaerales bacterium]|nr:protein translocase subunit SecD [Phycisphaerales bacterium]